MSAPGPRGFSDGEAQAEKSPGLAAGARNSWREGRSEHEGIIYKALGGELLGARHQREWVNLNRRGGNPGLRVRPSCDASHDQGGDAGCEQLGLAHLNPPV